MLVAMASGDAYGAGFKCARESFVKRNNKLNGYVRHFLSTKSKPGEYTGNTQMLIAMVETIINDKEFSEKDIANKMVSFYRSDKRDTYSNKILNALNSSKDGLDFISNIKKCPKDTSCLVRSLAVGMVKDPGILMDLGLRQCNLTNDDEYAFMSSNSISLAVNHLLYENSDFDDMMASVRKRVLYPWDTDFYGRATPDPVVVVDAVFSVLKRSKTLKEVVFNSVALGGETDIVAGISSALFSLMRKDNKLPSFFREKMERGDFGRLYLLDVQSKISKYVGKNLR